MGSTPIGFTKFDSRTRVAAYLPLKEIREGSSPSGVTKLFRSSSTVEHAAVNRAIGVRFPGPEPLFGGEMYGAWAGLYPAKLQIRAQAEFESQRRHHVPGLSSGDGASPTKKISGVRSATPVPFLGP